MIPIDIDGPAQEPQVQDTTKETHDNIERAANREGGPLLVPGEASMLNLNAPADLLSSIVLRCDLAVDNVYTMYPDDLCNVHPPSEIMRENWAMVFRTLAALASELRAIKLKISAP